jgi:hypothetical protein
MRLRKHRSLTAVTALACVDLPVLRLPDDLVPNLITADVPGYTLVVLVILGEGTAELTRSSRAGTSRRADLGSG